MPHRQDITGSADPDSGQPPHTPIVDLVEKARRHGIGDVLRRTARRDPHRIAIIAGPVRWNYREFNAVVNQVGHSLTDRGLGKGDRLAVLSRNNWQLAVLVFATAKLGIVLVPINFMLSTHEVAYILEHAAVAGLVLEDNFADTGMAALAAAGTEPGVFGWVSDHRPPPSGFVDFTEWTRHSSDSEPDVAVADDDPLRLMYTSGTESRPKGVLLSSRSLISQYVSCIVDGGMAASDIEVHALPMYHCAQLDCFFCPDVYLGATNVILPSPEPSMLLRTIAAERVTKLFAPPTVWISLLRSPEFAGTDLSSLRKGYYGASAMPVEVLREIQLRIPWLQLWNFYGQTEMAPVATILPPDEQSDHAGSAGRPVLNVETAIVDEDDVPVPAGQIGEIVHRSPQAALGYYREPAKTAEAFRNGWFHTGDLGVFDGDGRLSVVDRKKDMIKTGGENVASREVEEVIYRMPAVAEVAAFGVAHPIWIEAVVVAVVPRAGHSVTDTEVLAHCRAHLARFKTPKFVMITDSLPKNPSGKILKRDLRRHYADLVQEEPQ